MAHMDSGVLVDALNVVLTWGPERAVPELERLRERQPLLSTEEAETALKQAWQVMRQAEALAPGVKTGGPGVQKLLAEFPWVTEDQAGRAIQQGLYYHWRETGE